MRSSVFKADLRGLFWVGGVLVLVDQVGMTVVVAMIVRMGVCMTMGGRMVRMKSRRLMG
jgi:hypothetical protein